MNGDAGLNALIANYNDARINSRQQDEVIEVRMIRYLNLVLLIEITDEREETRVFLDGVEQFGRSYTHADRVSLVAQMIRAGLKQVTIAQMLKTPASTISKDVHWLRLNQPQVLQGAKRRLRKAANPLTLPKFTTPSLERKWEKR